MRDFITHFARFADRLGDNRRRERRALYKRLPDAAPRLLAHGVRNNDRQNLNDDYRLAVFWQIATPVLQAAYDIPPVIWWDNLGRILLAVDDLGCCDLLT